jgi:hypothetical protein
MWQRRPIERPGNGHTDRLAAAEHRSDRVAHGGCVRDAVVRSFSGSGLTIGGGLPGRATDRPPPVGPDDERGDRRPARS